MGGLFKKKENTSTTTTELPDWVRKIQEDYAGDLGDLRDQAAGLAGGGFDVAGIPPELEEALGLIRGAGESAAGTLGGVKDSLAGIFDPTGGDYESEYTDDVVDTTLAGMERQAQRDQLARDARGAAVGGTSNTRGAVGDAIAGQLTGMNMAEMEAKLRDDAFRFGTDASFKERGGFTDVQDMLAGIADQELGQGLQLGGAISGLGDARRGYEQEELDSEKDALSWLGGMFGAGSPSGVGAGTGTTTQTTPGASTFSQILGAGSAVLGGMLSDPDAKQGVEDAGSGNLDKISKISPKSYEYKAGLGHRPDRHTGLMADEVDAAIPGAVRVRDDGLREVDSYMVLATVVGAVNELNAKVENHGESSKSGGAGL